MKILLVDDEPLARQRLRRLLEKLRPDAVLLEAASGDEALAVLAREEPSLLLLDIRMPGIDGLAVAAELDRLPQPPAVVFCTAYDEYALEAGCASGLKGYREWLYAHIPPEDVEAKRRDYYTPEEIDAWVEANGG